MRSLTHLGLFFFCCLCVVCTHSLNLMNVSIFGKDVHNARPAIENARNAFTRRASMRNKPQPHQHNCPLVLVMRLHSAPPLESKRFNLTTWPHALDPGVCTTECIITQIMLSETCILIRGVCLSTKRTTWWVNGFFVRVGNNAAGQSTIWGLYLWWPTLESLDDVQKQKASKLILLYS